jgi:DNA-binding CsgD family transcriptional regulator
VGRLASGKSLFRDGRVRVPPHVRSRPVLVGRGGERETLDDLVGRARDRTSGAAVIVGEPGVGKTALAESVLEDADDFRVLRATGVANEAQAVFGGLLAILWPLLSLFDQLPGPQADTLHSALGFSDGGVAETFAVAVATLSVLALAAQECPIAVFVDDLQWLDRSSSTALLFAARRLHDDRVVFIATARSGEIEPADLAGLEVVTLEGLGTDDAIQMLAADGIELAEPVARALVRRTRGNPLALREVALGLDEHARAGVKSLPPMLTVGAGVTRAFLDRVRRLDDATQLALVVAALEASGDVSLIDDAIKRLDGQPEALAPAESVRLIHRDGETIRFVHPLLRHALVSDAPAPQRRQIHAALAQALAERGRHDWAAWHRGAAATGPDDSVAGALEAAAMGAMGRGDHAGAGEAFARAAQLSESPDHRSMNWFAAGMSAAMVGLDHRKHFERALADAPGAAERAPIVVGLAMFSTIGGDGEIARRLGRQYGDEVAGVSPLLGAALRSFESQGAFIRGEFDESVRRSDLAWQLAGDQFPGALDTMEGMVMAVVNLQVRQMGGRSDPALSDQCAAEILRSRRHELACPALYGLLTTDRIQSADNFYESMLAEARTVAALPSVVWIQGVGAWLLWRMGRLSSALAAGMEAVTLAPLVLGPFPLAQAHAAVALVHATTGDSEACRRHAAETVRLEAEAGIVPARLHADVAVALDDVGHRRMDDATARLAELNGEMDRRGVVWIASLLAMPEYAEALARSGDHAGAAQQASKLRALADGDPMPTLVALARRIEGLLCDDLDNAVDAFGEARATLDAVTFPFEVARTDLYLGERLRRAGRRTAATAALRSARDQFERIGASPWEDQAASELRAAGVRRRRPRDDVDDALTPQQHQIATLAATGSSTRDIATALFISPKTVETHLTRVYAKLGVANKAQLAAKFRTSTSVGIAAADPR